MTIKKLDLVVLLQRLIKVIFSIKLISKKVKIRIVNIHQCLKITKKIKDSRMGENRSSSFYGEKFYQKARKKALQKKSSYRETVREFYDQESQLQILRYYKNLQKKCEMNQYFALINNAFEDMREEIVMKNDEYHECILHFTQEIYKIRQEFHSHKINNQFLTRQQYINYNLRSMEQTHMFWLEQDKIRLQKQEQCQLIQINEDRTPKKKRLLTCNLCPIAIEQFEQSFDQLGTALSTGQNHWDQLNGHQKMNKYRSRFDKNLKVLLHQLNTKCEYPPEKDQHIDKNHYRRKRYRHVGKRFE